MIYFFYILLINKLTIKQKILNNVSHRFYIDVDIAVLYVDKNKKKLSIL